MSTLTNADIALLRLLRHPLRCPTPAMLDYKAALELTTIDLTDEFINHIIMYRSLALAVAWFETAVDDLHAIADAQPL